jgi:hypothetical protein
MIKSDGKLEEKKQYAITTTQKIKIKSLSQLRSDAVPIRLFRR